MLFRYEQIPQNTATYNARIDHRWNALVDGAALGLTPPFLMLAMVVVVMSTIKTPNMGRLDTKKKPARSYDTNCNKVAESVAMRVLVLTAAVW